MRHATTARAHTDAAHRERLLHELLRREEIMLAERRRLLRDGLATERPEAGEAVDSSADTFARDVGAALLEATSRTVQAIEDALARVRVGSYGTCQDCAEPIPTARLQALPFALRCRDCQERFDPGPSWPPVAA